MHFAPPKQLYHIEFSWFFIVIWNRGVHSPKSQCIQAISDYRLEPSAYPSLGITAIAHD